MNFDRLNEMVDSFDAVIKDVEKETERINNNVVECRKRDYTDIFCDLDYMHELCKTLKADISIHIDDTNNTSRTLRFGYGNKVVTAKSGGCYYGLEHPKLAGGKLAEDNSTETILAEGYSCGLGCEILNKFTEQLQLEMKKRADNAHDKLKNAQTRAIELGYAEPKDFR